MLSFYRSMNEQITPSASLIQSVMQQSKTDAKVRPKRSKRKQLALVLAAVICILIATPVLAANVSVFYEGLYAVAPEIAQFFKPVRESCVDNGIQMEVISTFIDADTAQIYVSMRDLEADRIDETTDLFDSYAIHTPFSSTGTCQMVSYEEESRTATFLIQITQADQRPMEGGKVTFSVDSFLSHKQKTDMALTATLSALSNEEAKSKIVEDIRGTGGAAATLHRESARVLASNNVLETPAAGVTVTGIGFVNQKLRVQMHYDDILTTDNHGSVYLLNAAGEQLTCSSNISFWDETKTGSYEEYEFDLTPQNFSDYTLYGTFWTCDPFTQGNWQVTIALDE